MASLAGIAASVGELQAQAELTQQIQKEERALKAQKASADYAEKLKIEADKRSQAWDLEKMELASRHDFALNEQEYEIKRTKAFQEQLERDTIFTKRIEEGMEVFKDALTDPNHPYYNAATKWLLDMQSEKQGITTDFPLVRPEKPDLPFTAGKVQMVLGAIATGEAKDPMWGIPTPLKKPEEINKYVTQQLGPNWRETYPEVAQFINQKLGRGGQISLPSKPSTPEDLVAKGFATKIPLAIVRNDEDYAKLFSGQLFLGTDGTKRRKP